MINPFTQMVFQLVSKERERQNAKWGEQNHNGEIWSLIATEELGEVSEARLEMLFKGSQNLNDTPRESYITELIQLTAVCVAWLECELRNGGNHD